MPSETMNSKQLLKRGSCGSATSTETNAATSPRHNSPNLRHPTSSLRIVPRQTGVPSRSIYRLGHSLHYFSEILPSVVAEQIRRISTGSTPAKVDVVKVSHHGSKRNASPELLACFRSRHFLLSTNGALHKRPTWKPSYGSYRVNPALHCILILLLTKP